MAISTSEFRPSINIIRDAGATLNYISTANGQAIFQQLAVAFQTGRKSFNIIGAYGTGKSAFLWALEETLNHGGGFFEDKGGAFQDTAGFEVLRIIGTYESITKEVAGAFGLEWGPDSKVGDVLKVLEKRFEELALQGKGMLLLVDEFGKFLEYAARNNPDAELYFLQLLAEQFNDPERQGLFVTTLHQDFGAYSLSLSQREREEWSKVKGRFKELSFNEPVEHLLYLASERLGSMKKEKVPKWPFNRIMKAIGKSKAFPLRDYFDEGMALKLFPLDILAAGVLTFALQRFGQNQRSLFSFLDSADHLGLDSFLKKQEEGFFHLGKVFDYVQYNFHSFLNSKFNPEHPKWSSTRQALEKAEVLDWENRQDAIEAVKAIGLLHIFAPDASCLDLEFMGIYLQDAMGIDAPAKVLLDLEAAEIIKYSKFQQRFVPKEGTDLDIELAIDHAGKLIEKVSDVVPQLDEAFDFPFVLAKDVFYEQGIPRIFGFQLSGEPLADFEFSDQVDGYVNLVFSEQLRPGDLVKHSVDCAYPVLFGHFGDLQEISRLLLEIQKVRKVIRDNQDDRIAQRELGKILASNVRLLNHEVMGRLYGRRSKVRWYWKGTALNFASSKAFNRTLSNIAKHAYPDAPVFHNEMVNRSVLSSPIQTARKKLIHALIERLAEAELGFKGKKYPPERSIYLALLKATGIHREAKAGWELGAPDDPKYAALWSLGEAFFASATESKRNLAEFVDQMKEPPLKLKQGFIDFWLPIFLFIKRDAFALFTDGKYVPYLTEDVFHLIHKSPRKYEVKAFKTDGVHWMLFNRYRSFLQLSGTKHLGGTNLIETIRPFLVFYTSLPDYAKQTKVGIGEQGLKLRDAISTAKDPEVLFFETFPRIMGVELDDLKDNEEAITSYIEELKTAIRELRTAYIRLLGRLEAFFQESVTYSDEDFPAYKTDLQNKLRGVRKTFVRQDLRVLLQRIQSPLDDRDSWLASVAQAIMGKPLDRFTDADEQRFYEAFLSKFDELLSLVELSDFAADDEEDVFRVELLSPSEAPKTSLVRLSPGEKKLVESKVTELEIHLGELDQKTILAILKRFMDRQ